MYSTENIQAGWLAGWLAIPMNTLPDINALLQQTAMHLQQGMLTEAESLCREILRHNSNHADANYLSGLIAFQRGQLEPAIQSFKHAITTNPHNPAYYLNLGIALYHSGNHDDSCIAWKQATRLNPDAIEGYINLGAVLIDLERPDEALAAADHALRINPESAEAHVNRGNALVRLGHLEEAAKAYKQAIKQRPNMPQAHNALGNAFRDLGHFRESLAPYERALELHPEYAEAWSNYGQALWDLGNREQACQAFKTALEYNPDLTGARYLLASMEYTEVPSRSPTEYVTELFDRYADRFDKELVERLQYRTPQHLYDSVLPELGNADEKLDILDLGCGTGLCGTAFAGLSNRMTGVDLSSRMLAVAEKLGIYTQLVEADVNHALAQLKEKFNLILSGDVFVYIGDLEETFRQVTEHLKAQGLFAFSIEHNESGEDFLLRKSGRYAHSPDYIRRLAEDCSLEVSAGIPVTLRHEDKLPMAGFVFVLKLK